MDRYYWKSWAAHIRSFILRDDFYQIKYYLDALDISTRKFCVDYKCFGSTALIKACELLRHNIIRYLVQECNADVNIESDTKETPLYIVCSHGDLDMVEYLLYQGADIKWTNVLMQSYLMLFIESGSLCKCFISHDIDTSTRDLDSKTAFDYALEKSALVSLEMLIERGEDINRKSYAGEMPVAIACKNFNIDLLEYLISRGGNIHHVDDKNRTYLMCHIDKHNICEVLVYSGINVNSRDTRNRSALHYITDTSAELATLSLLLINDADIFSTDICGKNALHGAIEHCSVEKVNCLLSCGADPNCRDGIGKLIIQYAIDCEDNRILRCVLDYGADVHLVNDTGMCAIHYAVNKQSNENMVWLLLKFGSVINCKTTLEQRTPLHYAVMNNDLNMAKFLLTYGSEVDCIDQKGRTPIHYAVRWCHSPMITLLYEYGADLNAKDNDGIGPMHEAAILKKFTLAEDLLQHLTINNLFKIESYELMAADFLMESDAEEGFDYLSTALTWRETNSLLEKPTTKVNAILKNTHEPRSHHDLINLGDDLETVLTQAAIIKARIMGPHNKAVIEILENIVELDDVDELVTLGIRRHILETALKFYCDDDDPIQTGIEEICNFLCYGDLLSVAFKDITPSMSLIIHAFDKIIIENDITKLEYIPYLLKKKVIVAFYVFSTFASGDREIQTAKKYLRRFLQICPEKRFVHIVFNAIEEDYIQLHAQTIKSFLEVALANGYPINTVMSDGSTPLHKLLERMDFEGLAANDESGYSIIVRYFLASGIHVCKTDRFNQSVLSMLQCVNYPICEVRDRTLQCLAAEVIIENNLQFENIVPVHLCPFIKNHGDFHGRIIF